MYLVLGVLVLGVFFTALSSGTAQTQPKDQPKTTPKDQPKGTTDPKADPPHRTIHLEINKNASPDVAEAVRIINEKLEDGWKKNKVTPSRQATDAEFIRRASLDIIGRIATPAEIEQFYKDPESTRRSLLIDRLLENDDYPRHWANMWTNWLLSRSGTFGRGQFHDDLNVWLEDQFAQNAHYDKIVTLLITAEGSNKKNAATNFILAHLGEQVKNPPDDPKRVEREGHFEMVPVTSRITRLFLGTQVQCAQCHDHPFLGNLKQHQFWGVNAFLRQVNRQGNLPPMNMRGSNTELTLVDDKNVNVRPLAYYEKRNGVILRQRAEFLPSSGKKAEELDEKVSGVERRKELAKFLVDHDQFPRAAVNRMWGTFFGKGFVNPIDDFTDQNQPSNPELLNELAVQFKHYNYDLKKLIRWMCNSDAYSLSCVANKTNESQEKEVLFSRMLMKSMTPEQLFESLMIATNSEAAETKQGKVDLKNKWLESLIANFGDDEGNEVNFNGTVVQALMMMNGKEINDAITRKDKGTVDLAIKTSRSADEVITKLYLATLNRRPTPRELSELKTDMLLIKPDVKNKDNEKANMNNRYYDLFWALLNCNEFLLNH
jgi:hypothetical protein